MRKRDWTEANAKRDREGCRLADTNAHGDCAGKVQSAHILGRRFDREHPDGRELPRVVEPDEVVGLCGVHHTAYDERRLDLLPFLTLAEQAAAVRLVGIVGAFTRITGTSPITNQSRTDRLRELRERMAEQGGAYRRRRT